MKFNNDIQFVIMQKCPSGTPRREKRWLSLTLPRCTYPAVERKPQKTAWLPFSSRYIYVFDTKAEAEKEAAKVDGVVSEIMWS